jgi:two-component system, OmpR family, sensor kinase
VTRISLRLRLTLAFTLVLALVLAAMGFVVYRQLGRSLMSTVDQNLRRQAAEAKSRVKADRPLVDQDAGEGGTLGQLLDSRGRVVRSTPSGLRPLVGTDSLRRASGGAKLFQLDPIPGRVGEWRVLAVPVESSGRPLTLVLARSIASREEALDHLLTDFLIAGPLLLLLASLAGYGLAAAALRPVEAMRLRAEAISAATPGRRLPVPPSGDEISRLASTLNDMLGRLEAAFAHERRFVADASHELRTPLALLRTELELALRRPRSASELERAVRSAAEETERLSQLAEDLLLIARSDQGRLPIRRMRVPAVDVLEAVAERFARRAQDHGQAVVVEPAELELEADPVRVEQALGNLVDNALAHDAPSVRLSARPGADGLVELHVTDDGPGFPEDFVAHAFDRFTRADEARGRGGTGLGLAIVDLIAQAHGGSAGAANRPQGGADVWLAVPAAEGSWEERSQLSAAQSS